MVFGLTIAKFINPKDEKNNQLRIDSVLWKV